jgi:SAM-dependent methyltransferase
MSDTNAAGRAPVPFEPHRFRSTVPFYAASRVPYPEALVSLVVAHCGLSVGSRMLDLGCGPGLLALAFAPHVGAVVAVDPEPAMLEAAEAGARAAGVTLTTIRGSSYDLDGSFGSFDLVTIGRAFHWMDRPATLRALDRLIEPAGAIALFHDSHLDARENDWRPVFKQVTDAFGGEQGWSHRRQTGPRWVIQESVLLVSPFRRLERLGVVERRDLTIDRLVGRALSMSGTSPDALGERRALFEATLRDALAPFATDGALAELVETSALIARRPA